MLDNVAMVTQGTGTPESEDDCDNGGWMTLTDAGGNPFTSAASCYAYATGTTVSAVLPGGACDNITFTGTEDGSANVPAAVTCVLAPGSTITADLTVRKNATLWVEGATVGQDLLAHRPMGVDMENGVTVGRDLIIHRIQGVPGGEPANEFCNVVVGRNMRITSAGPEAPIDMTCDGAATTAAAAANQVANDLVVTANAGPVTIESTDVGRDATITGTAYMVTVAGNKVAGNLITAGNRPASGAPADALAVTTAFRNTVGQTARCSDNATGSSCRASRPGGTGSSAATHTSHGDAGSGGHSRHRRAKRIAHLRRHERR